MICEIAELAHSFSFVWTWLFIVASTATMTMLMSGFVFAKFYSYPSYETWRTKSNPKYPPPSSIRNEIVTSLKGLGAAAICPALSIYLKNGVSKAYCGVGEYGVAYLIGTFVLVVVVSDFFEFLYHRFGHTTRFFWNQHKDHHVFFNPSPFAVIADGLLDQTVRALPLLVLPMLMPINMDVLFFTFAAFFYGYGVYLHSGHELSWPDAHHPVINTSFQHYLHHSISVLDRPLHTGFFVKLWDQMFGSIYDKMQSNNCLCAKCCCARGERTKEQFEKIVKPDYSVLLRPSFWVDSKIE